MALTGRPGPGIDMTLCNTALLKCALRIAGLSAIAMLSSCGGGSDDTGPTLTSPTDSDPADDPVNDQLPDFVVQQFSLSPSYSRLGRMSVLVDVANIGDATDSVPGAWLMISETDDFSKGYAIYPFRLFATDNGSEVLEPGAEFNFQASLDLPLSRNGTHYARVWLNPDLSAYFMNPEDRVVASHTTQELDTSNNRSAVASFEASDFNVHPPCSADALEENDTLDTAAPILLDTSYTINDCHEQLDIFSIELQAGQVYEITTSTSSTSNFGAYIRWRHAVIDPAGHYVIRTGPTSSVVFEAESTGVHHIVMRHIVYRSGIGTDMNFIINPIPSSI